MLIFLLLTIISWFAGNCVLLLFFQMIQPGEALDIVFKWQKMLERLYGGSAAQRLLGKALGDCQKCFAFWFMPLWFAVYYGLSKLLTGSWITDFSPKYDFWVVLIWYCIYHSTGAITGAWTLFKFGKKDGM